MFVGEDLIDNIIPEDEDEIKFKIASQGERLTNFIIDLVFRTILAFGFMFVSLILFPYSEFIDVIAEGNLLVELLIGAIETFIYYTIFEAVTNGKSLGKYITKTRAVREDASPIGFFGALSRSLCRVIPFDAFSFLGNDGIGWHDSLSGTLVIKDVRWKEWKQRQAQLN